MGDYCSELFPEGGGYFVVIDELFVVEGYWLVGGSTLFLTGHFGNEPEKTSLPLSSNFVYCFWLWVRLFVGHGFGLWGYWFFFCLASSRCWMRLLAVSGRLLGGSRTHTVGMWCFDALSWIRRN